MIITVTLNPALDKTMCVPRFCVGSVNRVEESRLDPGGKGINVSKVIRAIGGESVAMGIVGGTAGEFIRDQLDQMGIRNDFAFARAETRTNLKVVDPEKGTNTDINEPGAPVERTVLQEVWEKLSGLAKPGDTVVFAGKNPPGVGDSQLAEWITQLRQNGVRVALDTVGTAMKIGVAAGPTIIKPNESELAELCETTLPTIEDLIGAARHVAANGVNYVVVSLGADGALFVSEQWAYRAYGVEVPVGSTVGAGDAMLASILLDLERGRPWEEIAARSVAVSAANVMCSGSQPAGLPAIEPLIARVRVEKLS